MNILLVDDDYYLAQATSKLIQFMGGHNVQTSDQPTEIFQQCQAGSVDLVMMDVELAGAEWEGQTVNGADLSHLLKTQPQTAHIPIVLITGHAGSSERASLLARSQADQLLTKPITDYSVLLDLITQLVNAKSGSEV